MHVGNRCMYVWCGVCVSVGGWVCVCVCVCVFVCVWFLSLLLSRCRPRGGSFYVTYEGDGQLVATHVLEEPDMQWEHKRCVRLPSHALQGSCLEFKVWAKTGGLQDTLVGT